MNTTLNSFSNRLLDQPVTTTKQEYQSLLNQNQEEPGPTSTDVAWAAGLFEGEGCITFKTSEPNCRILTMTMTDKDVMERFVEIVDYGRLYHRSFPDKNWKDAYEWRVSKHVVVERILKLFLPYLGERRSERANEALRHYAATY